MEPFTWMTVASLLVKYGEEVTDFIVRKINAGGPVTAEEWAELKTLSEKTPKTQLIDAVTRAGLAMDDPKVIALFNMLPK